MSEYDQIRMTPSGHRLTLVLIAMTKRAVRDLEPDSKWRLDLLERLDSLLDERITAEVASVIEPISDAGYAICKEAMALDRAGDRCKASFDVITGLEVFAMLTRSDPSLITAINIMSHWRS